MLASRIEADLFICRSCCGPYPVEQQIELPAGQPHPRAVGTLQDSDSRFADAPAGEESIISAGWTRLVTRCSSVSRWNQWRGAVMAEPGLITDSGHADRADGVHVPLVQCEISTTEVTGGAFGLARGPARRAPDHGCIVGLGSLDFQDGAAQTSKAGSLGQFAGVVLTFAFGTGDEQAHSKRMGQSRSVVN